MVEPTRLIVIGAATALLEIIDLVAAINAEAPRFTIVGALDDDPALEGTTVGGVTVLGGLALAREQNDVGFVFAISSYRLRVKRVAIFAALGIERDRFVTLIHPRAEVSPHARLGHGCAIYGNAVVAPLAQLGDFVVVYNSVFLSASCAVADFAMVASLAFVGAKARLGIGAFVAAAAAVAPGITIGAGGMVAMASAAYRDVAPGVCVLGNPADPVRSIDVPEALRDGAP